MHLQARTLALPSITIAKTLPLLKRYRYDQPLSPITIINHQRLSPTITNYHQLSPTITNYLRLVAPNISGLAGLGKSQNQY
ncbi:hypothetical protein YpE1979001_1629 [Yersinia pestis biovar Antiqua str. E1979001]|nr:hypothetical protein YpE1979001_1629 [Yersinia pestis biovar Antiqua str. E1979001]